jgi:hypothetical protein
MEFVCDGCGGLGVAIIVQRLRDGRLSWSAGYCCNACGARLEADGGESLPDDYRRAILLHEGEWAVFLEAGSSRRVVATVLRELFGLTAPEAMARTRDVAVPVWIGTRAECDWIRWHVERRGNAIRVGPSN